MERINLVELLKDCIGMELDCAIFNDARLEKIDPEEDIEYPIQVDTSGGHRISFTKYGTYLDAPEAKCLIFPKGKTTWEGFVPPRPSNFKDGDVIVDEYGAIAIYKQVYDYDSHDGFLVDFHCGLTSIHKNFFIKDKDSLQHCGEISSIRLATKEEKEELFQAIKDNGYKWNEETKILEKLNEPKFKNGDILYCDANDDGKDKDMFKYIFIFNKIVDGRFYYAHCHLFGNKFYETKTNLVHDYPVRFATEEEKERLFQAIKDNGYKWNEETKILEKSVELRFKVGDKIRDLRTGQIHTVTHTFGTNKYISFQVDNQGNAISYEFQDDYELVPDKFDINSLVPFESKVLVRSECDNLWRPAIFGFYLDNNYAPYYAVGGTCWEQCIPYEGNEHLRGKIDNCDEFFRTWEKTGD